MPPFRILLACALLAATPAGAADTDAVTTLATKFCAAVRASDEAAAEAMMTQALRDAIARLRATSAAYELAHPGDKPPLGDGVQLTGFPDYPESCLAEAATENSVVLVYAPAGQPEAVWRDRLDLVTEAGGALKIADIAYAPDQSYLFSSWLSESAVVE